MSLVVDVSILFNPIPTKSEHKIWQGPIHIDFIWITLNHQSLHSSVSRASWCLWHTSTNLSDCAMWGWCFNRNVITDDPHKLMQEMKSCTLISGWQERKTEQPRPPYKDLWQYRFNLFFAWGPPGIYPRWKCLLSLYLIRCVGQWTGSEQYNVYPSHRASSPTLPAISSHSPTWGCKLRMFDNFELWCMNDLHSSASCITMFHHILGPLAYRSNWSQWTSGKSRDLRKQKLGRCMAR